MMSPFPIGEIDAMALTGPEPSTVRDPRSRAIPRHIPRLSGRFRRTTRILTGLVLLGGGAGPPAVAAQSVTTPEAAAQPSSCGEGVIARVEVINHSLFAPADIAGRSREWAYHVVNRAHIRTREGFIRKHVLVEAGQCYDALQVSESGRLLRELSFMARAQERAIRQDDGSWVVEFETWDEWTTMVSINASVEDSFEFEGLFLEEKNLLGRGGQAVVEYHRFRERRDLGLKLLTRRFLGTLAEAFVIGGTTRNGYFLEQEVEYPFRGEGGGFSFTGNLFFKDSDRSYYTGDREGVSHLLVPVTERRFNGSVAWRFGDRGHRKSLSLSASVAHPRADGAPRFALENSYDELVEAPDSLVAGLGRQSDLLSYARVGVTGGLRSIRFETRQSLDLVYGVQDVAIGTEAAVTLGRTLASWGTRELGSFAAVDLFASGVTSWMVAQTVVRAEGHLLDASPADRSPWRDMTVFGHTIAYVRPPFLGDHTLIARLAYAGAWGFDDRRQFSLGGPDWVRSFVDYQAPVSKRIAARLEERWRIPNLPPALDLGLSAFVDVGRGWAGDLPFSRDIPWTSALGGGVRLALPARSGNVFRMEMAWPTNGSAGPVFRVVKDRGRTGR